MYIPTDNILISLDVSSLFTTNISCELVLEILEKRFTITNNAKFHSITLDRVLNFYLITHFLLIITKFIDKHLAHRWALQFLLYRPT